MLDWFKKRRVKKDNKMSQKVEDAGQNRQEALPREEPVIEDRILDEEAPTVSQQVAESGAG